MTLRRKTVTAASAAATPASRFGDPCHGRVNGQLGDGHGFFFQDGLWHEHCNVNGLRMRAVTLGVLLLASTTGACLVPPALETIDGGSTNHAPEVLWGSLNPKMNESFTVFRSADPKKPIDTQITAAFYDPDPQVLYLRAFVDGARPDPASKGYYTTSLTWNGQPDGDIRADFNGDGYRSRVINISGLCDDKVNYIVGQHDLEVYASDTGFVTSGDLRRSRDGGQSVGVLWRLFCK